MPGILVVSNDGVGLAHTLTALHEAGYEARGASSFEEAKRFLADASPDLVIADECLGAYNGLHIIMRARAIHPDVSAIVTTPVKSRGLEADARTPQRRVDAEAADAGRVAGAGFQDARVRARCGIGVRAERGEWPRSLNIH